MILWGLNPRTWRELDAHDQAFCVAHYRLKHAYDAHSAHVGRKIAEQLSKEKADGKKHGARLPIISPVSRWSAP